MITQKINSVKRFFQKNFFLHFLGKRYKFISESEVAFRSLPRCPNLLSKEEKRMKKPKLFLALCTLLVVGMAFALPWFFNLFLHWYQAAYPIALVLCLVCGLGAALLNLAVKALRPLWKSAVRLLIYMGLFVFFQLGFSAIMKAALPQIFPDKSTALPIGLLLFAALAVALLAPVIRAAKAKGLRKSSVAVAVGILPIFALGVLVLFALPYYYQNIYSAPEPTFFAPPVVRSAPELPTDGAILFVSPQGNDENDGSQAYPLRTPEKALQSAHLSSQSVKNIVLAPGEYRTPGLELTATNNNTTILGYGDGEVILNGAMPLDGKAFRTAQDLPEAARLPDPAHVFYLDLKTLGLTRADWGEMNAIGSFNTAASYTDGKSGDAMCELFINKERVTVARYPNGGAWLRTGEAVRSGFEAGGDGDWPGDIFKAEPQTVARVTRYHSFDDVWMFGWWRYDWADAATPLAAADTQAGTLTTSYASRYLLGSNMPYCIYNVLEELDEPGEWYLDRDSGRLYVFPKTPLEDAQIDLTLTTKPVVNIDGAANVRLQGLTVEGTRSAAVKFEGENIEISRCLLRNCGGTAVVGKGDNNIVKQCEITATGCGGISLEGGDRETLAYSHNVIENNFVHDWAVLWQTYQPAAYLGGVGGTIRNNEFTRTAHMAVGYSGNFHEIAYNKIHNVDLMVDGDQGAIYAGRHWDWYGTKIRHNVLYNLGEKDRIVNGIYIDDALSGQEVTGNILINVSGGALFFGGGRDNVCNGNLVVTSGVAIHYDARERGVGWNNEFMWEQLRTSPWKTPLWQKTFPQLAAFSEDISEENSDNPNLPGNPADNIVTENVVLGVGVVLGGIDAAVYKFSTVEDNHVRNLLFSKGLFQDYQNGDYRPSKKALKTDAAWTKTDFSKVGIVE
jgi:hypothetical protein